jgi:4-hydroxy-tetrahydrodipicolinate synthase
MHESWKKGDARATLAIQERLMPLHRALFAETSPAPVKYAASLLGHCAAEVRLPLVEPMAQTKERIAGAMRSAGILN